MIILDFKRSFRKASCAAGNLFQCLQRRDNPLTQVTLQDSCEAGHIPLGICYI